MGWAHYVLTILEFLKCWHSADFVSCLLNIILGDTRNMYLVSASGSRHRAPEILIISLGDRSFFYFNEVTLGELLDVSWMRTGHQKEQIVY